jgi:hypothetical protein
MTGSEVVVHPVTEVETLALLARYGWWTEFTEDIASVVGLVRSLESFRARGWGLSITRQYELGVLYVRTSDSTSAFLIGLRFHTTSLGATCYNRLSYPYRMVLSDLEQASRQCGVAIFEHDIHESLPNGCRWLTSTALPLPPPERFPVGDFEATV